MVYDNINFTWRKYSQRLDSKTDQVNMTTSAVIGLPKAYTYDKYQAGLSVVEKNKQAGKRSELTLQSLFPDRNVHHQLEQAFEHAVRGIMLHHVPGFEQRKKGRIQRIWRKFRETKPVVRPLLGAAEKTEFFPLPAIHQEEASVRGTLKVVEKIFVGVLDLVEAVVGREIRLLIGDWLTIRNLRLMKEERTDEDEGFSRMDWVQEAAMPFHFQLNAMYMLVRTHLGFVGDNNSSSLDHHRTILRRRKLDTKKPEYNTARELVEHSLIARVVDCVRYVSVVCLNFRVDDLPRHYRSELSWVKRITRS